MPLKITSSKVLMIALDFQEPINLAFLEFRTIPRVLFQLTGDRAGITYTGIGEAAIDFPFVDYDLWDVFWCLSQLKLEGGSYPDSNIDIDSSLPPIPFTSEQLTFCRKYPAALTALTMASDDLWGRAYGQSLTAMTGAKPRGPTSWSIGFCDTTEALHDKIIHAWQRNTIPKIKLGKSISHDLALFRGLTSLNFERPGAIKKVSADFNAAYTMDQLKQLFSNLDKHLIDRFEFIEQPLKKEENKRNYAHLSNFLKDSLNWQGYLVADESVITQEDAINLSKLGWSINYKMQKIGGLRCGLKIEEIINDAPGMVGGTLPTAIGRAYDLWAGASLSSCTLPSDAWMPSTEWFTGDKHLILEEFSLDTQCRALPFSGPGLGITPDWEKIERYIIPDPKAAFRAIRTDQPTPYIDFRLRHGQSYHDRYRAMTGTEPLWNL